MTQPINMSLTEIGQLVDLAYQWARGVIAA
jgi:hypothetical protein